MEVSVRLVGSAAFKAVGTSDPRPAGSIPVHLRQFARRRLAPVVAFVAAFLCLAPPTAVSADPAQPGNTESLVESIEPASDVLRVDIVGGDAFVRVRLQRGHSLAMNGYYDEPFLRIESDGSVFVNTASETHRLSRTRYGALSIGGEPAEMGEPVWFRASSDGTMLWHDHRVHWMSTSEPEAIDGNGLVQQWVIPLTVDGVETIVSGSLYVREAPGFWWWFFAAPLAAVAWLLGRTRAPRVVAGAGAVVAVTGAFMFWGIPSEARGAPSMFALGVLTVLVAVATVAFRRRGEVVDALLASSSVALLVAVAIERDVVTNRFAPGLGDPLLARIALPMVAGVAIGVGARSLKRLLGGTPDASS